MLPSNETPIGCLQLINEYVLVDQYRYHIEHYIKTSEKRWTLQECDRLEDTLQFTTVPTSILLDDIYTKVVLGRI